jgi:V/A-type H+-transporting ATPase subunit B
MRADFRIANAVERVEGPLLFLRRTVNVGKTAGLGVKDTVVSMLGEPVCFDVGPNMLGRVFDSIGRPLDGDTPIPAMQRMRIDGMTINPARRALPRDFIETGITAIDLMNSLVRGQKLPLFSGGGLPHDRLATSIAQRARLRDSDSGEFAVVFVGIGVSHDVAEGFRSAMESSGALGHTVMFLNRADESSAQRLLAPRFALTAAEYLAFVESRHVLVIMTDMTNYCEALREVSASHGEIPGRKGFPGYMYSDLASLFERAGCLHGYRRAVYPPINVLPSLSRLMDYGTGEGFTDADHPALASQLFAAYANARRVRVLASVMGQEGLSDNDRDYLAFGDAFEEKLINQPSARKLEESMAIGWEILGLLAESELTRLDNEQIIRHVRPEKAHA